MAEFTPPPPLRKIPGHFVDLFDEAVQFSIGPLGHWFNRAVRHVADAWTVEELAAALFRDRHLESFFRSPAVQQSLDEFREILGNSYHGPFDDSGRRVPQRAAVLETWVAASEAAVLGAAPINDAWWKVGRWTDEAVRWIADHGASRIMWIDTASRDGIREIVRHAFAQGDLGRRGIERALLALDGTDGIRFGLDPRRAAALARYGDALAKEALPAKRIKALMERRYRRLLKSRARSIAQTEAVQAANAAQEATYAVAASEGQIDTNLYVLEWVARAIRCPRCAAMDGATREIAGGLFVSDGTGPKGVESRAHPDLHPNGWCFMRAVRRSEARRLPSGAGGLLVTDEQILLAA